MKEASILARSFVCLLATQLAAAPSEANAREGPVAWEAPSSAIVDRIGTSVSHRDAVLTGTLHLPRLSKPVPVLIALHPASSPTREAAIFDHLVEMLPALGVAVFVFDRRGAGESSGTPAKGDYNLLADDAIAVRRALAKDKRIDSTRTGFWGLSQGGWIAMLASTRDPDTAFSISVSAPVTTPDVQMNFAVENILRIKGVSQAEIEIALAARRAVDGFMRGEVGRPTAQAAIDRAASYTWFGDIYLSRTFADPDKSGWAKEIRHDPLEMVRQSKVRMLMIYGARDPWIPVAASVDTLAREQAGKMRRVVVIPDADHSMMTSATPEQQIDSASFGEHRAESAAYLGLMAAWLERIGIGAAQ